MEQKKKRIWTEEEIKTLIQENDKVLYGALKRLYAEQTADEQASGAQGQESPPPLRGGGQCKKGKNM